MTTDKGIGFVEAVVIDVRDLDRGAAFWSPVVGCAFGPSVEPTFRVARLGSGLRLILQESSEVKSGKNRVHVDVEVPELEAALRRVEALGGGFVRRVESAFGDHVVCVDPDGNEFCLTLALERG